MKQFTALLLCNLLLLSSQALAQQSIKVDLKKLSQTGIAEIPAGTSASTVVDFYIVLKGNITSQIGVELEGPQGMKGTVEAAQVIDNVEKTLSSGNFWKIYVGTNSSTRSAARSPRSVEQRSTEQKINCEAIPEYLISLLIQSKSQNAGRPVSKDEICSQSGSSAGSNSEVELPSDFNSGITDQPQIDLTYGAATGFVQKDNCAKVKNYLVRMRASLSNIAPEVLAQGFKIAGRIQEAEYTGPRPASLKPVSDGKYAPRPLLLMQSIGGNQWINLVSWSKRKPRILKKVATSPSLVYWRGYVLTRTVADSLLAGGRGEKINFEVTNGSTIYNICGKRARVRWRVNGYPG